MTNPAAATSTHTLVIEREYPYPQEKLWRALTDSNLIQQWLMDNDFHPTVGRAFQMRSKPVPGWNGLIDCEVLAAEPPRLLSYTWTSMGLDTVVTFTLTSASAGTLLRMEQSGFPATDSPYFKGASYGWQSFLGKLEQVVGELE